MECKYIFIFSRMTSAYKGLITVVVFCDVKPDMIKAVSCGVSALGTFLYRIWGHNRLGTHIGYAYTVEEMHPFLMKVKLKSDIMLNKSKVCCEVICAPLPSHTEHTFLGPTANRTRQSASRISRNMFASFHVLLWFLSRCSQRYSTIFHK